MKIRNRESRGEGAVRIVSITMCVSEADGTNKSAGFFFFFLIMTRV